MNTVKADTLTAQEDSPIVDAGGNVKIAAAVQGDDDVDPQIRIGALEVENEALQEKLAAANIANQKLEGDLMELRTAPVTPDPHLAEQAEEIATLKKQLADAQGHPGEAPPPAPAAEELVKRVKFGKTLKLPLESTDGAAAKIEAMVEAGEVFQMALVDEAGVVQPFPVQVGGADLFTMQGRGERILFARDINIGSDLAHCSVKYAVLLDADAKVLSVCQCSWGGNLVGGKGFSALIPANSLSFAFALPVMDAAAA